jgi:hypothetical protein
MHLDAWMKFVFYGDCPLGGNHRVEASGFGSDLRAGQYVRVQPLLRVHGGR